jgi:plastocyanin
MADRTRTVRTHFARRAATFLVAALAASVVLGCGGSSAQGMEQPPASLDPASPRLSAEGLAFDRAELAVPAGEAFVIVFENREAVSHNVSIYADDGLRDRRFEGVLFGGPATRWYPVPALEAGTYRFVCDLHPTMAGRLIAG